MDGPCTFESQLSELSGQLVLHLKIWTWLLVDEKANSDIGCICEKTFCSFDLNQGFNL